MNCTSTIAFLLLIALLNVINGAHVAVKITVEEETHQYEQSPEALSELSSVYESPQTSDQEFTDADGVHYNLLPQLNDQSDEQNNDIDIVTLDSEEKLSNLTEGVENNSQKVICYFTNWAWYRQGQGKYLPDNIDASLCTHIVYGFATLDGSTLTMKPYDTWADIDNKFYQRVTDFKKKGVKVSVAIGGWNDSAGDKYGRMVRDAGARSRFVTSVIAFIEKYHFEGLDIDWEYPVCWQGNCQRGKADEKRGFAELVRALSAQFKKRGWVLSVAVSPSKTVIDPAYDVPQMAPYVDWIGVMNYDYHGQWDGQTGHIAPLYHYPGDKYDYFNCDYSIKYWIKKGAPANKLIMGIPTYGQSFTLANANNFGLNAKATGGGQAGPFTRVRGFMAYYEICEIVKRQKWSVVQDPKGRMGPYAHKGNQWVSYDDVASVQRKVKYMRDMKLGGAMIWALDLDDFRGSCGAGKYPLLTALRKGLRL